MNDDDELASQPQSEASGAEAPSGELDPRTAELLRSVPEQALWAKVGRRLEPEFLAEEEEEEEAAAAAPEGQSGRWPLPEAPPQDETEPRLEHLYAALDGLYVQQCLAAAGLRTCTSPNQAAGGCVVVAADATLVYYWGSGLPGRHDGWTAADVMLQAYEDVLTKHDVYVTRQHARQVQDLCLRCWVPRRETARGIEQQLDAGFNPVAADTPERQARDRRLAVQAVARLLAELAARDAVFPLLQPEGPLRIWPWMPASERRPMDGRTLAIARALLHFHLEGVWPTDVTREALNDGVPLAGE